MLRLVVREQIKCLEPLNPLILFEKLTWWLAGILIALCIFASVISTASGNIGTQDPQDEPVPTEQPVEPPIQ
jgi:hypothetical protein